MFKYLETKSYDLHHSYGTDWCTDYICKSDENLEIDDVIQKLKELGKNPCGEISMIHDHNTGYLTLKTKMY